MVKVNKIDSNQSLVPVSPRSLILTHTHVEKVLQQPAPGPGHFARLADGLKQRPKLQVLSISHVNKTSTGASTSTVMTNIAMGNGHGNSGFSHYEKR